MVPQVHGGVECKGPKGSIEVLWPVNQLMHHHGTGPGHDGLTCSFSHSILEVSANSAVVNLLILEVEVLKELGSSKWMIIGAVLFNLNAILISELLELMFDLWGFTNAKRNLVLDMNETRGVIDVDSATGIPINPFLLTTGMGKSARLVAHILVDRDTLTRAKMATSDGHFGLRLVSSYGHIGCPAVLLP